MPGRLIDLGQTDVRLPDALLVDTSLVVARLNVARRPPTLPSSARAAQFFQLLQRQPVEGVLTPLITQEFFHVAIRELFRDEVPNYHDELHNSFSARRRFD